MSLEFHTNVPLKDHVTMHLGGNAAHMVTVHSADEVKEAVKWAKEKSLSIFVLGGGSNTLVHDEGYPGLVIHNQIPGFEVLQNTTDGVTIKVGAGEPWDDVVRHTVEMGLSGIECLSAIPGTAGAAPVQNIGAYGEEVKDTIVEVGAYDEQNDSVVTLTNADCQFSYRNSIFRGTDRGRYIILSVTFRLSRTPLQPPFYKALQDYLDAHQITDTSPQAVRDAIIAIRSDKLPDPKLRPNTGSFFKNAVFDQEQLAHIQTEFPDVPTYLMGEKYKVPTGWLIEKAGLKGQLLHGMKVHDKNALVLINESANSYDDLAAARDEIIANVYDNFHVRIEQEPLEMQ